MKTEANNNVVILNNDEPITKEAYEKLAKNFKERIERTEHFMWKVRRAFDEAFTKYENSNPNGRKLKDFELHEKRLAAQKAYKKCREELENEKHALEEGVLKYGIDIREEEVNDD